MSNPWFGDTAVFLVHEADPEDPYVEGCGWELWQRLSLKDSVFVCGLPTHCSEAELNGIVTFFLPRDAAYEVWSCLPESKGMSMAIHSKEAS
jgi:hypothetical protein